jgi:hypothetical protein
MNKDEAQRKEYQRKKVRTVTWFPKFLKQDFGAISILERDSYLTVNTHFLHYKVKLVNAIFTLHRACF